MLDRLLAGTEWREFAGYMSPAFVGALPPKALARQLGAVARAYLTKRGVRDAARRVATMTTRLDLPIAFGIVGSSARSMAATGTDEARGDLVLRLYFAQLLGLDVALLDFRAQSFCFDRGLLTWEPAPLVTEWSPSFISSVRRLYAGFYREDVVTFRSALAELGLEGAEAELRRHFGADQSAVRFRLADFRKSMNAVFGAAARSGAAVAPEMVTLGIALACLYEHLETLACAFDVRRSYFAVADAVAGAR